MSLRDIFRSLHLIVRAPHDARFPLGLIFPLNPSLGIWPPEQNIYLKFLAASEAKPAAGLDAGRWSFTPVSSARRAATAGAGALGARSQSRTISERFGGPRKGKGPGFACEGKAAAADP